MVPSRLFKVASIALAMLATSDAFSAARLASFCYARETEGRMGEIEGTNAQKRLPIASVSKIATAHWLIVAKGLEARFETRFHIISVGAGVHDVHIEGSRDPYFGKQSLHFAISELNKKGVKKVRTLSFDENFKFLWEVTGSGAAQGYFTPLDPKPSTVVAQLRAGGSLTAGYATTLSQARAQGIQLVASPSFAVQTIKHVAKVDFKAPPEAKSFAMKSATTLPLIKEMNRNSNNHAANQMFEHLGGQNAYPSFIKARLGLEEKDIRFLNGSGDRYMTSTGKIYNEASCAAVLKVIHDLRVELWKADKGLTNVMAVAGGDANSTVAGYNNSLTTNALIAKTGTINTDITLGGLVLTKQGNFYFMYNIATDGPADWPQARAMIRQKLIEWVRGLGGGKPLGYKQIQFMSFDAGSNFADLIPVVNP